MSPARCFPSPWWQFRLRSGSGLRPRPACRHSRDQRPRDHVVGAGEPDAAPPPRANRADNQPCRGGLSASGLVVAEGGVRGCRARPYHDRIGQQTTDTTGSGVGIRHVVSVQVTLPPTGRFIVESLMAPVTLAAHAPPPAPTHVQLAVLTPVLPPSPASELFNESSF